MHRKSTGQNSNAHPPEILADFSQTEDVIMQEQKLVCMQNMPFMSPLRSWEELFMLEGSPGWTYSIL
jgi:hypothetical protein